MLSPLPELQPGVLCQGGHILQALLGCKFDPESMEACDQFFVHWIDDDAQKCVHSCHRFSIGLRSGLSAVVGPHLIPLSLINSIASFPTTRQKKDVFKNLHLKVG